MLLLDVSSGNTGLEHAIRNEFKPRLRCRFWSAVIACHNSTSLPQYLICVLRALKGLRLSSALSLATRRFNLYRVPEIVTRGRFPDGGESDSTWRTQEARHV